MVNIYDDAHDPGGWRKKRLRRFLEIPRDGHPLVLFVGISPGKNGAAVSGVGFSSKKTFSDTSDPRLVSVGEVTKWVSIGGGAVADTEPTATHFWKVVGPAFAGIPLPVTWNAVPFWTYETKNRVAENRSKLLPNEVAEGKPFLAEILDMFKFNKVVAVGGEPSRLLHQVRVKHIKVRHPSYGGASDFSKGVNGALREL